MTADEVTKQIDEMVARCVVELRADTQRNLQQLREVRVGFNERLRTYWGGSFDHYELLCACMQEVGADLVKRNAGKNPPLFHALSRTHAKACRVADEIYVLLANGHGGGALARCRTLHEFSVIAAVLAEHDGADEVPDIAERYLTYGGWTREHGDYGWASGLGGRKKPSFATLEEAVDLSHLRPEFRAASHEIHADSEGLRSNLFARGGENYALSGPTNAGLSRPGQLALIYLYQVTTTISAVYPDVEDQVFVRAIGLLLDEACLTFDAAERAVERAEEELQDRLRQEDSADHGAGTASRC